MTPKDDRYRQRDANRYRSHGRFGYELGMALIRYLRLLAGNRYDARSSGNRGVPAFEAKSYMSTIVSILTQS